MHPISKADGLPGEAYSSLIRARFWLVADEGQGYLGIGRIKLLENIDRFGSINQAAKAMGMSYKKAWKLIDEVNRMTDQPLVISEKGGATGGGTRLTTQGQAYVASFRGLEARLSAFLQQESERLHNEVRGLTAKM